MSPPSLFIKNTRVFNSIMAGSTAALTRLIKKFCRKKEKKYSIPATSGSRAWLHPL
jgi:hypothetical protein